MHIYNIMNQLSEIPRKNEIYADVLSRLSILMSKKGDVIRSRIYSKAQDVILGLKENITEPRELEGKPGIGPTIIAKLTEYTNTGTLEVFEREKENPEMWLTDIYGIGPKKAQELVKNGIKTIDDLREQQDNLLNDKQKIGLKYYDDIQKRIPRDEIDEYNQVFNNEFKKISNKDSEFEIVGSYRRGAKTSGDIDVIITADDSNVFKNFIDNLKEKGIIVELLSYGKTKSLVIAKLPGKEINRRVDFMYTTKEEYPFAILYFTGSKSFNTVMRSYALKLGLSLNEHGMYIKEKGKTKEDKVSKKFNNEKDIFDSLYLKYKKPEERLDGRSVETTLPIIKDEENINVEKKGQSCYKSCDNVPVGECVTGCSPSWADDNLIHSRNWCTCNLNKEDCVISLCPAHTEPTMLKQPTPEKKQRKTRKKREPSENQKEKKEGSPKKRKTKKKSPEKKEITPEKKEITPEKTKKIRKLQKKVKLVEIVPRLTINENEIEEKVETDDLPELAPILYMDKNENKIINNKEKKNKTIKKLKIIENDKENIPLNYKDIKMTEKIKNAKKIIDEFQQKGISVLENLKEEELTDVIEACNHSYYNTKTPLTNNDNEYDIIKEYIERKYPSNGIIEEIGAKVMKNKVKLPYVMASMDKIKPDTNALVNWCQKYKGPYVLSCKLDGVSGLYTTEGEKPKLYTRGNGTIGQDISHLIPVLNLPKEKDIVVRGEFIIPRITFDEKYKTKFANARNLVSGIVNSKSIDNKAKDMKFVAYEVIKPHIRPSEQMQKLEQLGHIVVQNKNVENLTNEMLSQVLMDWRTNYEYEIDGVIVTDDRIHERKTGNPDYAFAFKMVISDQVAEAKVVDVIWTPSKSGYLKPRVRIEPIKLGGVTIEYATGFNGKFIEENKIGIGSIIQIIRSGDVIPYIKTVTMPAENAKMPLSKYHWTDTHVDIVLDNVNEDSTVQEKNITDFFTAIEVDGLGPGNVKKIMEAGYRSVPDIIKMKKEDYNNVKGFKEKMINKIYDGIKTKVEEATLITIMAASNKFGRGIGKRKITPILDKYPNILLSNETVDEKITMLQTVDGIGKENAKSFANNIDNFKNFLEECGLKHKLGNIINDLENEIILEEKIKEKEESKEEIDTSNPLYEKHIVMTKVRDQDIIKHLKKVGGILDDNISKKTFILIVKSLDDVSNKTKKANSLNIPIMTPETFKYKFID